MVCHGTLLLDAVPRVSLRDEIDVILEELFPLTSSAAAGHHGAAACTGRCVGIPGWLRSPLVLSTDTWRFLVFDHIGQMLRSLRGAVPEEWSMRLIKRGPNALYCTQVFRNVLASPEHR